MRRGLRLPVRYLAALLLVSPMAAVPASAHDHDRLVQINRDADTLLEALNADSAGVDASLAAARTLLGVSGKQQDLPDAEAATGEQPAGPLAVDTVLLAPLLQNVALETGNSGHRALIEAAAPSGGQALLLESGGFTLATLAETLAGEKQDALLSLADGGYRLAMPLAIAPAAALLLKSGDRLEMATERGVFIVNLGHLTIGDATVTGSAAAGRVADFHPFILTVRGGRAEIENSEFSSLGFDGQPLMSGVSFASSRYAGRKSSGRVIGNVFSDIRSVEVTGIEDFRFERNRVERARGIGLRLERVDNSAVSGNVIFSSGLHGVLMIGSKDTALTGNVVAENGGHGILARDGIGHVTFDGNAVVANGSHGIALSGGACADIDDNAVLRNHGDGIQVAQSLGVDVSGNLLAGNMGTGIAVTDSIAPDDRTVIAGNTFFANVSGISAERFAHLLLKDNDLSNQLPVLFAGALQYETPRYLTFRRNLADGADPGFEISGVGDAAPSLFRGNLGQFSLSDYTGCDRGEEE